MDGTENRNLNFQGKRQKQFSKDNMQPSSSTVSNSGNSPAPSMAQNLELFSRVFPSLDDNRKVMLLQVAGKPLVWPKQEDLIQFLTHWILENKEPTKVALFLEILREIDAQQKSRQETKKNKPASEKNDQRPRNLGVRCDHIYRYPPNKFHSEWREKYCKDDALYIEETGTYPGKRTCQRHHRELIAVAKREEKYAKTRELREKQRDEQVKLAGTASQDANPFHVATPAEPFATAISLTAKVYCQAAFGDNLLAMSRCGNPAAYRLVDNRKLYVCDLHLAEIKAKNPKIGDDKWAFDYTTPVRTHPDVYYPLDKVINPLRPIDLECKEKCQVIHEKNGACPRKAEFIGIYDTRLCAEHRDCIYNRPRSELKFLSIPANAPPPSTSDEKLEKKECDEAVGPNVQEKGVSEPEKKVERCRVACKHGTICNEEAVSVSEKQEVPLCKIHHEQYLCRKKAGNQKTGDEEKKALGICGVVTETNGGPGIRCTKRATHGRDGVSLCDEHSSPVTDRVIGRRCEGVSRYPTDDIVVGYLQCQKGAYGMIIDSLRKKYFVCYDHMDSFLNGTSSRFFGIEEAKALSRDEKEKQATDLGICGVMTVTNNDPGIRCTKKATRDFNGASVCDEHYAKIANGNRAEKTDGKDTEKEGTKKEKDEQKEDSERKEDEETESQFARDVMLEILKLTIQSRLEEDLQEIASKVKK